MGSQRLRWLVGGLVAAEALVLVGAGVFVGVETVMSTPTERAGAAAIAVLTLALGVALAFCARGVVQGRRWVRGPVITWQLLQAGLAMPMSASERWYFGVPLLAVCVVVGVLVAGNRVIAEPENVEPENVEPGAEAS